MTDSEKKMKKYCNAVERRLNLPREVKTRVMTDFRSSIQARQEAGMTDEQIIAELGTPQKVAADLNEQMKEYAYRKSPWRFAFAVLAIYGAWELLGSLIATIAWRVTVASFPDAASVGIIGGADGPTSVFVTYSVPQWYHYVLPVLLLVVGIWGFRRLRKCKQK